jgi:hypothetical protein
MEHRKLLASILIMTVFVSTVSFVAVLELVLAGSRYRVFVQIQCEPHHSGQLYLSMLKHLDHVDGVLLDIGIHGNDSERIASTCRILDYWLPYFSDYEVALQCGYCGIQGNWFFYMRDLSGPHFQVWNDTLTFSEAFYNSWYSSAVSVLKKYDNIVLWVGFNEVFNHFWNKADAITICQREYTIWKKYCSWIPFSTEFGGMPTVWWANVWQFPKNHTIEGDCAPLWANYSDFIGINLWADPCPPSVETPQQKSETDQRVNSVISMCKYYSQLYGKPIHIDEFPAWHEDRFRYIWNQVGYSPNICCVYRLWYPRNEAQYHDSQEYGLFTLDDYTHNYWANPYCFNIFQEVLSSPSARMRRALLKSIW